jgi:hypothetical protein|tara:strand:- start:385 stop:639 length:255 start_codon:yes stop_codon:yes gene_type:complete
MFKKFVSILWTYSPQDYWIKLWSKTSLDEKVRALASDLQYRYGLTASEIQDVAKALKEVGNQMGDIAGAVKGNARKGRKKKEIK